MNSNLARQNIPELIVVESIDHKNINPTTENIITDAIVFPWVINITIMTKTNAHMMAIGATKLILGTNIFGIHQGNIPSNEIPNNMNVRFGSSLISSDILVVAGAIPRNLHNPHTHNKEHTLQYLINTSCFLK